MNDDRPFWRSGNVLLALGALVVVVVSDAVLRHLGGKAADFTLFLGRFHPLVVHLPIGFVLLVGAAEVATLSPRLRSRLDPAIALALPLLVLATAGAFLLGHLLARSGDFAPSALSVHRRFELFAAVGICLCPLAWEYQEHAASARARWMYRGLLGVALGVLSIGAHFGGTLTRGDSYLTRYAPEPFKKFFGGAPAPRASASTNVKGPAREPRLFADVIQPILTARCVSCHGEEKTKGGLRLDSLAAMTKGGEDGTVVTPGNPTDSPLLARVLLPADDDDHMPPEGKPGPTKAEIAAIRFWIERGANDALLVRDLVAPEEARSLLEHALGGGAPVTPTAVSTAPATTTAPTPAKADDPPLATPPAPRKRVDSSGSSTPASLISTPQRSQTAPDLFANHCQKCHGPDKQKGKLRVDSLASLLAGGKSGPAVVPGEPAASLLMRRVSLGLENDKHMPPAKEPQLEARDLAALSAWIGTLEPRATTATMPVVPASQGFANGSRAVTASAANYETDARTAPNTAPNTAPASTAPESPRNIAPSPVPPSTAPNTAPNPAPPSAASPNTAPPSTPLPSPELLATLPSYLALYPAEVAPLLHTHCAKCHGGKNPSGGLAVDDYSALLKGGDTGPAITPGKPNESVLVGRISLPPEDEDHMPPTGERQLSPSEIALVSAWVADDGSASKLSALSALPAPAVAAIAANPPPRAPSDVAAATPHPRAGGCGACMLSDADSAPMGSVLAAGASIFVLSTRRRARARRKPLRCP
jgi:mono/diheme cytochrome c family protein